MVRSVLGVVVGVVVWMVGFWILATLLAQLWPDYAGHGRQWMRAGVFTFTPLMAFCNLVLWVLAETGAGWVAGRIARRREAVWVLAGLVGRGGPTFSDTGISGFLSGHDRREVHAKAET